MVANGLQGTKATPAVQSFLPRGAQSTPVPPLSHINFQCTAGFENAVDFICGQITLFYGPFQGIFSEGQDFFDP